MIPIHHGIKGQDMQMWNSKKQYKAESDRGKLNIWGFISNFREETEYVYGHQQKSTPV